MDKDDPNCYIWDGFYTGCHDEFSEHGCWSACIQTTFCMSAVAFIVLCIMPLWCCSLPLFALYYWIRYGYDGFKTKMYFPLKERINTIKWKNPNK